MKTAFVLKNYWASGVETILVDSTLPFVVGDTVRTTELWKEHSEPVEYITQVSRYEVSQDNHTLELLYSPANNPDLINLCAAWGKATISFNLHTLEASAVWNNNPPSTEFDGPAKSKLSSSHTREFLGLVATMRRRRRQDKFKRELLEIDRRCALSGETELSSLQAAHIVEVADDGGYNPSNGILLRADIHYLFDGRLLFINDDGSVTLSPNINSHSGYHKESKGWQLSDSALRRIRSALRERRMIEAIE